MLNKYFIYSLCLMKIYSQGESECKKIAKKNYSVCISKIKAMLSNEAKENFEENNFEDFTSNLFTTRSNRNIILSKNYGCINPNISFNGVGQRNKVLECIHNFHNKKINSVLNHLLNEMHCFAEQKIINNYDSKLNLVLSFGSNAQIIDLFDEIENNENINVSTFLTSLTKLEYEKLIKIKNDKLKLTLRLLRIVEKLRIKHEVKNITRYESPCKNCYEMFYNMLNNEESNNKNLVAEMMMYSYDISLQNVKYDEQFLSILRNIIVSNNLILHESTYYSISLLTLVFIWNNYENQLKNCTEKQYLPEFLGGKAPDVTVDDEWSDSEDDNVSSN